MLWLSLGLLVMGFAFFGVALVLTRAAAAVEACGLSDWHGSAATQASVFMLGCWVMAPVFAVAPLVSALGLPQDAALVGAAPAVALIWATRRKVEAAFERARRAGRSTSGR